MSKEYWKEIDSLNIPSADTVKRIAEREPILFSGITKLDDEYLELSYKYKYVFGKYLLLQTGLDVFDDDLSKHECKPISCSDENKDFFNQYDGLGLKFFYLRCIAHIERLPEEERDRLKKAFKTCDDDSWIEAMLIVYNSFQTVMAVRPDIPKGFFESIETLDHRYRVEGQDIPLAMVSEPNFDDKGKLISNVDEKKRLALFRALKQKVKTALEQDLGAFVGIVSLV